jgi:transposase
MKMTLRFAGCNVSRDHLDLHLRCCEGCLDRRLPNTLDGCAALIGALGGGVRLVVEASGGYEREIVAACHGARVEVALVEAGRVRHFARARGQRAKTDRIDAAVLAAFGAATMPPPTRPAGPDIELLKALRLRRQTLVHRRMADLCQLKQARAPQIVALIEVSRDRLGAEIDALDRRIATLIANSRTLVERARLMRSVPGIGPVSVAALIADMPELGSLGKRPVAALTGVAPHPRQSGRWQGRAACGGGRKSLRDTLWMAATTAVRDPAGRFGRFYRRLRDAGKPHKLAITAVLRKLVVTLDAILRTRIPYQP